MNYLVHLYLSGVDPEVRLGGIMGDFVKGPIPAHYSQNVALGLRLHRQIDTLAQNSRHTRHSRQRLQAKYGHGRGIVIDIFYDHFLAAAWADFSSQPLADFSAEVYRLLQTRSSSLPPALQGIIPHMITNNWLLSYREQAVVGRALQRIADRLSRPLPLGEAVDDLRRHEAALREDFRNFMAQAVEFSRQVLPAEMVKRV